MKNLKKVLALVLAFAMAFTMMATAGAAYTDQADIEATEAVDMLNAIGVMTGDPDGSFRPNDTITRAEACRMIYTIRTNSDDASAYADMQTTFKDVPADAWYAGYVKHCQAAGIVSGTSADGSTFEPNRDVTGVELALMCLRVMGYDPAKADIGGSTWSTKTIGLATEAGLLDGVNTTITSACPRQWAAQLMYNTIDARTVRWSNDSETYTDLDMGGGKMDKVGKKYMKLYSDIGTLTTIDGDNLTINATVSDAADSDNKAVGDHSFTKLGQDYSSLLGQKVKVLYREGKVNDVVGVYALEDNTSYSVAIKDIEKDGDKVKFDGASYGFDDGSKIAVVTLDATNEQVVTGKTMAASDFDTDANKVATKMVNFVDNDGDGKFNIAIITEYLTKEVTYVGSDRITAGATYKMEDENIADDIAKDDWAMISYNMYDECLDIAKADVVTDTLNSSKDKTSYKQYEIGSTWYNISNTEAANVSVGDTVKAYIVAGVVVKIDTDDGTGAIPSNIAVVVGKGSGTLEGDRVKLRFFDGTLKTVTLDDKGDVKTADSAKLGEAYKVSGTDSNTRLDSLKTGNKYNGYYYNTKTNGTALSGSVAAKTIKGEKVDDNAVVILYTTNGSSKKITGKQFNALDAKDLMGYGAAFTKDVNGLSRVMLAAVQVNSTSISGTSYDNYGYIVTDGSEKANGDIAFTMWNGSENVEVLWENGTARDLVKGTLVAYASIDENKYVQDGEVIGTLEQIKDDKAPVSDEGFTAAANKANDSKTISVGNYSLDVTADTHVLVLDTDADKDLDIGQPYTYGDKLATAAKTGDTYHYNVVYRIEDNDAKNDGADLDLVVVDVTGAFDFDKPGSTSTGSGSSEKGDVTVSNAKVNSNNKLEATVSITRPGYVPASASVPVTYDVYVNGSKMHTESATISANSNSAFDVSDNSYPTDASIEIKDVKMGTPSAVNVLYQDAAGKDITSKLKSGYTTTLSTSAAANIKFTVNTTDNTSNRLQYTVSGTKTDVTSPTNISDATAEQTINNQATGEKAVIVTIIGLENLVEQKSVTVATAWGDNSKTIADVTGGANLTDKAQTVKISKPTAKVGFTETSKNVEVEITVGAAATNALEFTLNTNDKIIVKKGATTGSTIISFTDSTELSIASVKELAAPTIVKVELTDTNGKPVTTYTTGDKIVITFSEAMDGTKTTVANLASLLTGSATLSTATWSEDNTVLTLVTATAALAKGNEIKIGGQVSDDLMSAATGMNVVSKTYTVGEAGTPLVEKTA